MGRPTSNYGVVKSKRIKELPIQEGLIKTFHGKSKKHIMTNDREWANMEEITMSFILLHL